MTDDRIVSEKISYRFAEIKPGDIVTFADLEIPGRTLVKRCIAVEGQTVNLQDGRVIIDGVAVSEPYTNDILSEPLNSDITYPYTVPEDCIWVMGDNRTNSQDSRYFGPIPTSGVNGHAILAFWPLDRIGLLQ